MGPFIEQPDVRYALRLRSSCVSSRGLGVSCDAMFVVVYEKPLRYILCWTGAAVCRTCQHELLRRYHTRCSCLVRACPALPLSQLLEACYEVQPVPNSGGLRGGIR